MCLTMDMPQLLDARTFGHAPIFGYAPTYGYAQTFWYASTFGYFPTFVYDPILDMLQPIDISQLYQCPNYVCAPVFCGYAPFMDMPQIGQVGATKLCRYSSSSKILDCFWILEFNRRYFCFEQLKWANGWWACKRLLMETLTTNQLN